MAKDKVYKKLLEIEKLLKSLMRKEVRELKLLGGEDKKLKKILKTAGPTGLIFNDPIEWKVMIAEICPDRKEVIGEKEAVFKCKITKDYCDYDTCPKNKI